MNNEQQSSWQKLADLVDGRFPPEEASSIEEWAGHDTELSTTLAWLRAFKRAGRDVALDDPAPELRNTLRAQFAEYASNTVKEVNAGEANTSSIVQRLIAALSFDSGLQLGFEGTRGDTERMRQLVYSVDVADISLTIQDTAAGLNIHGQILPIIDMALEGFQAQIRRDDGKLEEVLVDAAGHFTFLSVEPNSYQLTLGADALMIVIESIELDLRAENG